MTIKTKRIVESLNVGGGLVTSLVDDLVEESSVREVVNVEFSEYPFTAITRKGQNTWASVGGSGTFRGLRKSYVGASGTSDYFMAQRGTGLYRATSTGTTFTLVHSGLADTFFDAAQHDDRTYLVNGTDNLRSSNGATWIPIGNAPPQTGPTLAAIGTGSATGTYFGAYSFVYGSFGEGPIGPIGAGVTIANQRIRFSGLSTGGSGVTRRRFYLSSHSAPGTVYRLSSDGAVGTTFSTGAFTEDDLLDAAEVGLSIPPSSDRIEWHSGRMFYVPTSDRSQLIPSRAFRPDVVDFLDEINDVRDADGAGISAVVSLSNQILIVFTETATWALYGGSPATWKLSKIYEVGMPRGAFRTAVVINGKVYWKSRRHVYVTNGYREGTENLSLNIEPTIDSIGLTDANIASMCAIDYRPKRWYMLFLTAGASGLVGAASATDNADLSVSVPVVGPVGGTGTWNTTDTNYTGRLCLVFDYQRSLWTIFSLNAIVATTLNGRGDTGLAHIAPETVDPNLIKRFERPDGIPADGTSPINGKVRYSWRSFGQIANDKRMRRVWVKARSWLGAITSYFGMSKELGASTWVDSLPLSTQGDVQRFVMPQDSLSEHFSFYMGHSSGTVRTQLTGIGLEYKEKNRR